MSPSSPEARLYSLWSEVRNLGAAQSILGWDQETYMPPKGQAGRGRVLATLAGLHHARLTSAELGEAIDACLEEAEPDSLAYAQAKEAKRIRDRAVKVPAGLAREIAEATSAALAEWQQARKDSDFPRFQRSLQRILDLRRQQAAAIDPSTRPYDVLMDEFEPGATEAELAPLFQGLQDELAPLIQAVSESGREVDESPARGRFPAEQQRAFGLMVAARMGFDFDGGRLDETTHPFCTGFGVHDVRITWRYQEDDFRPALFGIMHEAGHGLYEQGLPEDWEGQPLGAAVSLGIHESQSRLWENLVGRSRAFWEWALPHFRESFPGSSGVTVDSLWPALHTVKPSFIRVEADEATYNLHVAARFEVERALIGGSLEVAELPGAWNDAYDRLLGIRPASDADGVLQDIHWAMGMFGYFPTYTLGNLVAAQLFETAQGELGDFSESFRRGEFKELLDWLRARVHRRGSLRTPKELVREVTGRALSPQDFLAYLRRTTDEVYSVTTA